MSRSPTSAPPSGRNAMPPRRPSPVATVPADAFDGCAVGTVGALVALAVGVVAGDSDVEDGRAGAAVGAGLDADVQAVSSATSTNDATAALVTSGRRQCGAP